MNTLHEHFMLPLAILGLHLEWWFVGVALLSLVISTNVYMKVTVTFSYLQ